MTFIGLKSLLHSASIPPFLIIIITTCDTEVLKIRSRAGLTAQIVGQRLHLWLRTSEPQDHVPISPAALLAHSVLLKPCLENV